jgi:type I restriction-modification system DNA methylase subunit
MSAFDKMQELVQRYQRNRDDYISSNSSYQEAEVRSDFIDEFLIILGWDLTNEANKPQYLRDVILEPSLRIEDELHKKKPDYALRIGGTTQIFIEAKKPSENISNNRDHAFQTRRYGWNAQLPISILTNFEELVIYDCRHKPDPTEEPHFGRLHSYRYPEIITRFDELYEFLSFESVQEGQLHELFPVGADYQGTQRFDDFFLQQIEHWREIISRNLHQRNPELNQKEINYLVQQLINRILFLRICEDRNLEEYKSLGEVTDYQELRSLFQEAESKYDSDLFDFIDDKLTNKVNLSPEILINIFEDLYYPESPYAFSVVDPGILGEIYEHFISREIIFENGTIQIVEKPEISANQGAVSTPSFIAEKIVEKTLSPLLTGKAPAELKDQKIIDLSCGSGTFLIHAYEYIQNYYLELYLDNIENNTDKVYQSVNNQYYLTLEEKRRILLENIFGVDIDEEAVEVTKFSLLLKLLEDTQQEHMEAYIDRCQHAVLPKLDSNIKLGNSLIDESINNFNQDITANPELYFRIKPFNWEQEYSTIINRGGFDAIIGNPPYTRIQRMAKFSPLELEYIQSDQSTYICNQNNIDKYMLFIERGLSLLKESGHLGFIVSNKFMKIKAGKCIRNLLSNERYVYEIIDFGVNQVFSPEKQTYTCILHLRKTNNDKFYVQKVNDLSSWKRNPGDKLKELEADYLDEEPWSFVSGQAEEIFSRIQDSTILTFSDVANIFVGLQTSKDDLYFIDVEDIISDGQDFLRFFDFNQNERVIEKSILRPAIHDKKLRPYSVPDPNSYLIFPYQIINGNANVYSPEEMEENYPHCWEYFLSYKEVLLDRSIQPFTEDTWYRYGRSQSLTKFTGSPKIIWSVLTKKPKYTFDDLGVLFTGGGNGPYYGLRPKDRVDYSIYFLLAILSSPILEMIVRAQASEFRGGYKSHGKQYIENLPVPDIRTSQSSDTYKEIVQEERTLIANEERLKTINVPSQRVIAQRQSNLIKDNIIDKVYSLYQVTSTELEEIPEYQKIYQNANE